MNLFSKIKFLHKNYGLGYWGFVGLLSLGIYIQEKSRNRSLPAEIFYNMQLTTGKTIRKNTGGYNCDVFYVYSVYGKYYGGDSGCFKGLKICKNYVIAYSKKDPKKSVLLPNYPLTESNYVGEIIDNNKYEITEEMLLKWVKSKNLYSSQADKVYTLKDYERMNPCKE